MFSYSQDITKFNVAVSFSSLSCASDGFSALQPLETYGQSLCPTGSQHKAEWHSSSSSSSSALS
jgi:hypothetical protein